MTRARVATARAIMTTAKGKAPHAVRLWRAGWNMTDKGRLNFTPRSANLVMDAFKRRGNPLVFDYEHEGLLPLEQRGGAPMRGVAAAPHSSLEVRPDENGKPELWARDVAWTPEAARQIESGERRQISPVSDFDRETREILAIVNVALVREGATHSGTLLASAGKGSSMEELIQKIVEALQAGDFETAETLVQQAEGMDGGGDNAMVKMARGACGAYAAKAMSAPAEDETKGPPAVAGRPMTASRVVGQEAFARQIAIATAKGDAAIREARIGRVEGLIAANRDCFDAASEATHMKRADPEVTREHIAFVQRAQKEGTVATIAASRATQVRNGVKVPKDEVVEDATHGLSEIEMGVAAQTGVSFKDFAASKVRNARPKRAS